MASEARQILERMHALLAKTCQNHLQAWDYLTTYLYLNHAQNPSALVELDLTWLTENPALAEALQDTYNPETLQSNLQDHIGEMYHSTIQANAQKCLRPERPTTLLFSETNQIPPHCPSPNNQLIFDPQAGSGKRLLGFHQNHTNAILFGVEPNLRLARIALLNMIIHKIPAFILHADSRKHELSLTKPGGIKNWKKANTWHSAFKRLHPKEHQPNTEVPNQSGRKTRGLIQ